jgi:multicomponent Na+:H+ antiporter subunit E
VIKAIGLFILWFLVWIFLSWPPSAKDVICAALVSLFVSFMTLDLLMPERMATDSATSGLNPFRFAGRCGWFFLYAVVFIWECFKANIDVAYRVLHPELPIRPGTIKVKVGLKSNIGLTFLANSITLTPGTTCIDVDKENGYMYIHWLFVKDDADRLRIVEKFENMLKRIFE